MVGCWAALCKPLLASSPCFQQPATISAAHPPTFPATLALAGGCRRCRSIGAIAIQPAPAMDAAVRGAGHGRLQDQRSMQDDF